MLTPDTLRKNRAIKDEFDRLINMSVEEMQGHFSSPDSDMASLNPKLSPQSGKALGKRALALKTKESWEDADYGEAETILRPLRWQLSRKVRYADADNKPTLFCTALRNRGHDPLKGGIVPVAESKKSLGRKIEEIRVAVQDALRLLLPPVIQPDGRLDEPYVWINTDNVFDDYAVAQWERTGVYLSVPYTYIDGEVIVDAENITEVEPAFVPVQAVAAGDAPDGILESVSEAEGEEPPKWYGVMIRAGNAKNKSIHNGQPRQYPAAVLKAAVEEGVFDGVPAYDRTDTEHLAESDDTKVGVWGKAAWDAVREAVVNTFTFIKGKYPKMFDKKLRTAIAEGKAEDLPGCSITGDVLVAKERPNVIGKIEEVRSCDWISFASAGGRLLAIQESENDSQTNTRTQAMKLISVTEALAGHGIKLDPAVAAEYSKISIQEGAAVDWMIATLKEKTPELFEGEDNMEAQLVKNEGMTVKLFKLHMKAATGDAGASTDPEPKKEPVTEGDEESALRGELRRAAIEGLISASGLSDASQGFVRRQFEGKPFDKVKVQEAIREAKDFESAVRGGGAGGTRIVSGEDFVDKTKRMVHDFFFQDVRDRAERVRIAEGIDGKDTLSRDAAPITPKALYAALTGDVGVTFDQARVRVSEAMDTTLASAILVEGMNTRLLYSFNLNPLYQTWRRIVRVVTKLNFKTNEAIVSGGFTGYATKTKGSAYATITETGVTKETYAILARGGMFSIQYEDIRNDDIDYMAGLPARLGDYAARMLSAFMWDLVTSNPTLAADSTAVFHTDHGNLATAALDNTALVAAILKLQSQTFPNSTDKMGLIPRTLVTSIAQQETAYQLTQNAYGTNNAVATFAQQIGIQPTINPHTADVTDYYLFADPATAPIIEAGFLDGRIEPEIQSSMLNGVGDWFTKRDAQFRIAHDYNAAWVSYKGAVAGIVAD